jgi:glycosyltransferase involved in cell wall biosynthesis
MPHRAHIATLRDPRAVRDWWTELTHPTIGKPQVLKTWAFYENSLARRAIRRMHGLYVPAYFLAAKAQRLYRLREPPGFLPTPVQMPAKVAKDAEPNCCFVGRWDRVKRPELFFDLAERMPQVRFIAIGKAHNLDYEAALRRRWAHVPNLDLVGYVDQFSSDELSTHLGRAWILINTSAKEALPNTFVEACAHRCAIVAPVDPDGFASRFGRHVTDGNYRRAVTELLAGGAWRARGRAGFDYVKERNDLERAAAMHIAEYRRHLPHRD